MRHLEKQRNSLQMVFGSIPLNVEIVAKPQGPVRPNVHGRYLVLESHLVNKRPYERIVRGQWTNFAVPCTSINSAGWTFWTIDRLFRRSGRTGLHRHATNGCFPMERANTPSDLFIRVDCSWNEVETPNSRTYRIIIRLVFNASKFIWICWHLLKK